MLSLFLVRVHLWLQLITLRLVPRRFGDWGISLRSELSRQPGRGMVTARSVPDASYFLQSTALDGDLDGYADDNPRLAVQPHTLTDHRRWLGASLRAPWPADAGYRPRGTCNR